MKSFASLLRTRYGWALATALAVTLVLAGYWFIWVRKPYTTEKLTFGTNVVAGTSNDVPLDVEATLFLPRGARFPISAVIIVPSSSGVDEEREIYYAASLARAGIAALVVDSYSARDLTDSVYDQSVIDVWDIESDAIAALRKLAQDDRIRADHIGILGVSKGGTAAMNTALTIRRYWAGAGDIAFAAHVAISPDCTWLTRRPKTTGAPVLFLLAELDDQTPAQPCVAQADRMTKSGNSLVETKIYKGANHAWEDLGAKPVFDAKAENYAKCRVWVEDDGRMVSADTGERVPEDKWHSWAQQKCMTLGATCCGGTRQNRDTATRDIIGFLRRHGF